MITSVARLFLSQSLNEPFVKGRERIQRQLLVISLETRAKPFRKKPADIVSSDLPPRTRTTVKLITSLNEITTKRKIFEARTLGDPRSLFTANRKNFSLTTTMKLILKNDAYS